jgi:hypothetical protein
VTKKDLLIRNLKEMRSFGNMSFGEVLKQAVPTIKPSKNRVALIAIIVLLLLHPIELCVNSEKTLIYLKEIVTLSNGIIIAIFAIVFTGYALFQALISRNTLKILFVTNNDKSKKCNMFSAYNLYFFILSILYIFLIISNYIIIFILTVIDPALLYINDDLKIFLLEIYFVVNIFAISEIKSFVFNLFQCFNISAISSMIESIDKYDDNLHEK